MSHPRSVYEWHTPAFKSERLAFACSLAGTTPQIVKSNSKLREDCHKRFHVMAILKSWEMSLSEIGRHIGRDHSSVYHGLKKWETGCAYKKPSIRPRPNVPHERNIIWVGRAWAVQIRVNGKKKYFGQFNDVGAAIARRDAALSLRQDGAAA